MKIFDEDQILDINFRKKVIEEITGHENIARKKEARKRYDVYKDRSTKYVKERLENEGLESSTVNSMMNRASNISICKKIVNKLARAYLGGAKRETGEDSSDIQVQAYSKLLNFDQKQKKSDKYRELYKNCAIQFIPEIDSVETGRAGRDLYNIKQRVFSPWQYDVIHDSCDREKARVYILSDFSEVSNHSFSAASEAKAAIHSGSSSPNATNRLDDKIADHPSDSGLGDRIEFIWWSDKYHFTTDENGQIIRELSPENDENPIEFLNFVNIAEEQDNEFWAQGGEDLIDGSILVNTIITDMFAIAYQQGWGQFVISGKNVSLSQKVGPHHAIVFEVEDKDSPQPKVDVVSANPPLDLWMKSIEQYVALLLSTNDLSPATVSVKLDAVQFPSGIAMIIEMSDAVNEVEDTQEMFVDAERLEWEIVKRWQNKYHDLNALTKKYADIGKFPDDMEVNTKFNQRKPVITEKEKLENIKIRKDLGINEQIDLIMLDNPAMSLEDAQEKLKRILEERIKNMASAMANSFKENENPDKDKDDDDIGG